MATSRSIPRMMQMTTAAFQAVVNLNQQATDPKAIPSSETSILVSRRSRYSLNFDGDPKYLTRVNI